MVAQLLVQGVSMFGGDNDKLQKIANIAAGALGRLPGMIDAVQNLFDGDAGKKLTPADFDALIAKIDANTDRINQLDQEAQAGALER
jgi:predicted lipoprotein